MLPPALVLHQVGLLQHVIRKLSKLKDTWHILR